MKIFAHVIAKDQQMLITILILSQRQHQLNSQPKCCSKPLLCFKMALKLKQNQWDDYQILSINKLNSLNQFNISLKTNAQNVIQIHNFVQCSDIMTTRLKNLKFFAFLHIYCHQYDYNNFNILYNQEKKNLFMDPQRKQHTSEPQLKENKDCCSKQQKKYVLRQRKKGGKSLNKYMTESKRESQIGKRVGGWFLDQKSAYLDFLTKNLDLYHQNQKQFFRNLDIKIKTRNIHQVKKFHYLILSRFGQVEDIVDRYNVTMLLDTRRKNIVQTLSLPKKESTNLEIEQKEIQKKSSDRKTLKLEEFAIQGAQSKKQANNLPIIVQNQPQIQKQPSFYQLVQQNNILMRNQQNYTSNPYIFPQNQWSYQYAPQYRYFFNGSVYFGDNNSSWFPHYDK